jgi:riboflavin synthase
MFTGIIKSKGKIVEIKRSKDETEIVIESDEIFENKEIGNSIAVDGVCLTITKIDGKKAHFNLMNETLKATKLKNAKKNNEVNLEPALSFGEGLDGHLVQGHIDNTGEVTEIRKEKGQTVLRLSFPKEFRKYLSLKGSITINGVSLTISYLDDNSLEVCLVEHTSKITTLSTLKKGDEVNLEFDAIAKYIKSLLDSRENEVKYEFLKDRGFI